MTSKWTAEDIPDLEGKVAIVTGANSGIGYPTVKALARKRATVILACRDRAKGRSAVRGIKQENPDARVELILLDLADLASVRSFAATFANRYDRLDILINNAGIMNTPFGKTVDGFELQFGTNHLGHFALTGLLLELLIRTPQARVVTVSSGGHIFGKIDFENLNAERGYDRGQAYGQSKLANLLFTYELQRRFERAGVEAMAAACHPGWTATNLQVHTRWVELLNPLISQTPEMGALPTLYAAAAPGVQGGSYYAPGSWLGLRGYPALAHSSDRSYDLAVAARLWDVSEELTGVRYQFSIQEKSI